MEPKLTHRATLGAICAILALGASQAVAASGAPRPSTRDLSPLVVAAMDPDMVSHARPRIVRLRNDGIHDLALGPKLDADFVIFTFMMNQVTSTERKILDAWLKQGLNKVLLIGIDMKLYAPLFGLKGTYYRRDFWKLKLEEHAVNTDCLDVRGNMDIYELPEGGEAIAYRGEKAAAGRFAFGKTDVYFMPEVRGKDNDRWLLNFYHWALGLEVPRSAVELINSSIAEIRSSQGRRDALVLRNGEAVNGILGLGDISLQTTTGRLAFKRKDVESIVLEFTKDLQDKVVLRSGESHTGSLHAPQFKIIMKDGTGRVYDRGLVKIVRFDIPAEESAASPETQTAQPLDP